MVFAGARWKQRSILALLILVFYLLPSSLHDAPFLNLHDAPFLNFLFLATTSNLADIDKYHVYIINVCIYGWNKIVTNPLHSPAS